MFSRLKINNKGFTIVETLIVLAIAAVIIIIVLLAVPALQRTSRNTNIKTDATTLGGGINEYESSNNGVIPNSITVGAGGGQYTFTGTGTQSSVANISAGDIVSFDTPAAADTVVYSVASECASGKVAGCVDVAPGHLLVLFQASCPTPANGTSQVTTVNPETVAIMYPIESTGVPGVGCVQE